MFYDRITENIHDILNLSYCWTFVQQTAYFHHVVLNTLGYTSLETHLPS